MFGLFIIFANKINQIRYEIRKSFSLLVPCIDGMLCIYHEKQE